jgi:tetratricopeptide (TPR) repeat protein
MKKFILLSSIILIVCSCSVVKYQKAGNQTSNTTSNQTINPNSNQTENLVTSSHSQSVNNKSTESPMARPIDVSQMTAEIEKAKKEYEKNPKSEQAKEKLADAYFKRAFALTEAAQYRAALGDFRKGLKLKKDDEAQKMHDKILEIFASLNRQPPKEGEEPEPLPFNK